MRKQGVSRERYFLFKICYWIFKGDIMRKQNPEYLYKVMKASYFEEAVLYGRVLFNLAKHIANHEGGNADPTEHRGEICVEHDDYPPVSFGVNSLIYCFTYDIESYLGMYPLKSNEVVLKFKFEDVLNFYDYLGVPSIWYGYVSYEKVLQEPMQIKMFDKRAYDIYDLHANYVLQCVAESLHKDKIYERECEYRFLTLPYHITDIFYVVPGEKYDFPAMFFQDDFSAYFKMNKPLYAVLHGDFTTNESMMRNLRSGKPRLFTADEVVSYFFCHADVIENKGLLSKNCLRVMGDPLRVKP